MSLNKVFQAKSMLGKIFRKHSSSKEAQQFLPKKHRKLLRRLTAVSKCPLYSLLRKVGLQLLVVLHVPSDIISVEWLMAFFVAFGHLYTVYHSNVIFIFQFKYVVHVYLKPRICYLRSFSTADNDKHASLHIIAD